MYHTDVVCGKKNHTSNVVGPEREGVALNRVRTTYISEDLAKAQRSLVWRTRGKEGQKVAPTTTWHTQPSRAKMLSEWSEKLGG